MSSRELSAAQKIIQPDSFNPFLSGVFHGPKARPLVRRTWRRDNAGRFVVEHTGERTMAEGRGNEGAGDLSCCSKSAAGPDTASERAPVPLVDMTRPPIAQMDPQRSFACLPIARDPGEMSAYLDTSVITQ